MFFLRSRDIRLAAAILAIGVPILLTLGILAYHHWVAGYAGPAISRAAAGRRIIVDPGHGGIDPGVTNGKVDEKELTLAISLQLKKLFTQAGIPVLLTRETDVDLCYSKEEEEAGRRKKMDLKSRVRAAEDFRADIYLGIHVNGSTSSRWRGPQTFYTSSANENSRRLAVLIQNELLRVSPTARKASDVTNQYILKTLRIPAVTVEVGFLSNPSDIKNLVEPDYQNRLAWAIFTGTVRFLIETPKSGPPAGAGPQS